MARQQYRDYVQTLNTDGNAIRTRFTPVRGRITAFTVQLEIHVEGAWRPVVRFDTAHGQIHRDLLDWHGSTSVKDWDWFGVALPYNEALTAVQQEIVANWATYRAAFLRRRP